MIDSKRLYLKSYTKLDSKEKDEILTLRNDLMIRQFMFNYKIITKYEHDTFIKSLESSKNKVYFAVFLKKQFQKDNIQKNETIESKCTIEDSAIQGKIIGSISLNNIQNKSANLGIFISQSYNNCGFGREALGLLEQIALQYFNITTLNVEVLACNTKAINFYKNLAFEFQKNIGEIIVFSRKISINKEQIC